MRQITSRDVVGYGLPWCYREDAPSLARTGAALVINLDDRGEAGTHWTACRLVEGTLYYADPFGTILNGWPPATLEKEAARLVANRVSFQRPSSQLCGYYAICFAHAMNCIDRPLSQEQFETVLYESIR